MRLLNSRQSGEPISAFLTQNSPKAEIVPSDPAHSWFRPSTVSKTEPTRYSNTPCLVCNKVPSTSRASGASGNLPERPEADLERTTLLRRRQAHMRSNHPGIDALLSELRHERTDFSDDDTHAGAKRRHQIRHYTAIRQRMDEMQASLNESSDEQDSVAEARHKAALAFYCDARTAFYDYHFQDWPQAILFAQVATELYPDKSSAKLFARWLHTSLTSQQNWNEDVSRSAKNALDLLRREFSRCGDASGTIACLWSSAVLARYAGDLAEAIALVDSALELRAPPCINLVHCLCERSKILSLLAYEDIARRKETDDHVSQFDRLALVEQAFFRSERNSLDAVELAERLSFPRLKAWCLFEAASFSTLPNLLSHDF